MHADDFQHWLDGYVSAWRSYDPEKIGALFSEDAVYRWHPWDVDDDVAVGRSAIVDAWLDDQDEPGSWTAEYRPFALDGERGVAVGVSRYLGGSGEPEREYHNVFLCRFDGDGRCAEFTELYAQRPTD